MNTIIQTQEDLRYKRIAPFDKDSGTKGRLESTRVIVVGGGTVGVNTAIALTRHFIGTGESGAIGFLELNGECVEPHNLHSAYTVEDIGRRKRDVLVDSVKGIDPAVNVEYLGEFKNYARLAEFAPDFVVSAFDFSPGIAKLHFELHSLAKSGNNAPPLLMGTDAGIARVLVHLFDYNRMPLFGNGDRTTARLAIALMRARQDDLKTDDGKKLSLAFVIKMLGIGNLDNQLISAVPRMNKEGSYAQHPGAGLQVGNAIALSIRALRLGESINRVSVIDTQRDLRTFRDNIAESFKDLVAQNFLRVMLLKLLKDIKA